MMFSSFPIVIAVTWLFCVSIGSAQSNSSNFYPTNITTDLGSRSSTPRFLLNGTEFSGLPVIDLAPLGSYGNIDHETFLQTTYTGKLVDIDATNYDSIQSTQFAYVSCDPSAYPGNLDSGSVYEQVVTTVYDAYPGDWTLIVIFYSDSSHHCAQNGLDQLDAATNVFTTVGAPHLAAQLAGYDAFSGTTGDAVIRPDKSSYTVYSAPTSLPGAPRAKKSSTPVGAIAGGVVGGVVVIVVAAILLYYTLERRKQRLRTASPPPVEDKPEMYAGPANQDIAGPVKPKYELRTAGTVQRKALPVGVPEKYSTTIEELEGQRKARIAHPEGFQELGTEFGPSKAFGLGPGQGDSSHPSTIDKSSSTRGLLQQPPSSKPITSSSALPGVNQASASAPPRPTQPPPLDPSTAAEADFAVQELGLISMRKRKLAEQASAAGKRPEEIDGRAGEQYRELVEREARLRRQLDEMHGDG